MIRLFISFAFLLTTQISFASTMACGEITGESAFAKEADIKAHVFNMENCESHTELFDAIGDWFQERSEFHNYQYEWFGVDKSDMNSAIKMMEEDHSMGDGEESWSEEKIDAVVELYTSSEMSADMFMGEYADSYYSGTGITALIFLQTKAMDRMIVIEKFTYAE